ncbi:MAG: winged helix-turn-helix domain-containing protein [Pseudomonadales bacterium]
MSVSQSAVRYQFGTWVIEPHLNRLSNEAGEQHQVEHKAMEVLCYLLEHAGQIVPAEELLDNVWPDRVVEPNVIHRNLSVIRHSLGDDPRHPTYIETISKRGYRTLASVQVLPPAPAAAETEEPRGLPAGFIAIALVLITSIAALVWLGQTDEQDAGVVQSDAPDTQQLETAIGPANAIAVLPFENLSPRQDDAYFSTGMHEEIIQRLNDYRRLRVIARTSVMRYADTDKTLKTIAAELNVGTVLTGTVRYEDSRVRVSAQLIDATTTTHVWSETYERELDGIFAIQAEIAASIADELNATLTTAQAQGRQSQGAGRNPQAYLLYLQAHHLLGLGAEGTDRLTRAEQLLQDALALDPNDITVTLELSRLYLQKENAGLVRPGDTRSVRKHLIQSALAVNPDHAIANAWLGWHALFSEGDHALAAQQYTKATALDPTNVDVMRSAVAVSMSFGRLDEALKIAEYVVQHDPLCAICLGNLTRMQLIFGQYSAAAASASSAMALSPDIDIHKLNLAIAQMLDNQPEAALQTRQNIKSAAFRELITTLAEHQLGDHSRSNEALDALISEVPNENFLIAQAHAARGEHDQAFARLDKLVQTAAGNIPTWLFIGLNEPLLINLHDDPRWQDFLTAADMAPEQLARYEFDITLPE